jgi:hypothetical protein
MSVHRRTLSSILVGLSAMLAACGPQGQASPIFGYRSEGSNRIAVRVSTADGWQTWVDSVDVTATTVVVHVRTRNTNTGSGIYPAEFIWLPIALPTDLAERVVIDGTSNTAVPLEPSG